MEALKKFLNSPSGAHIKRVFFDDKGNWVFAPNSKYPHEKSVDEILGEPIDRTVTEDDLEQNPDLSESGVQEGEEVKLPAETVEKEPAKKIKVTERMLKANPEWVAQGIKKGDLIELPAENSEEQE